jgi:hypothetical protein
MAVPKLLLDRVLNPNAAEPLVCMSIEQLSRKPEYPAEEAFEILVQAFASDPRAAVAQAILDGVVDVLSRAPHADTLARQLDSLRAFKGDRFAKLLAHVLACSQVPRAARLAAVIALAAHDERDLSDEVVSAIETLLRARLDDDREDAEVQRCIRTSFGQPRTVRPRVYPLVGPRDDETVAL